MKTFIICIIFLLLVGCASTKDFNFITGPKVTPEMERVEPVSDTSKCKFIKTVYFEVSHPAWMHSYAAKNVIAAGGDSYKILNNTNDIAAGMKILGTNIAIYKCRE